ncbi:MAG TPA: PadR family transcriptional regulator [Amycolatopsis sp.]|nr:PadR family transcriptional regulator [Amycolatopsis sp.]
MEKRRKVANPLALAVLAGLLAGPMHPYEMGRQLKETGKDRNIKYNRGSLYMVVNQLAKAGFIAEHETVRDTQRPERTVYTLTEAGRVEVYDWMRELVSTPYREYPRFGVALSLLAIMAPDEACAQLTLRLEALDIEITGLRGSTEAETGQGVPWIFLIENDYELGQLEAERRFTADLIEKLKQPDHVRAWHEFVERNPSWRSDPH